MKIVKVMLVHEYRKHYRIYVCKENKINLKAQEQVSRDNIYLPVHVICSRKPIGNHYQWSSEAYIN